MPFLHHFAGPFIRHQLLLHQVDPYRPKRRSILHRRSHILRKVGLRHLLAHGTDFALGLMFCDHQPLGRQIDHLATFHLHISHLAQILLAVLALLDRVTHHQIGRLRQHQGVSGMTALSTRLLAAALAQTLGLPMKAVRRWGQVAVVAVFLELLLQRLHLLTEPLELVLHLGNLLISLRQVFLPLTLFSSQLLQFFFGCHVATLSAFPSFDKSSRTPSQLHNNKCLSSKLN